MAKIRFGRVKLESKTRKRNAKRQEGKKEESQKGEHKSFTYKEAHKKITLRRKREGPSHGLREALGHGEALAAVVVLHVPVGLSAVLVLEVDEGVRDGIHPHGVDVRADHDRHVVLFATAHRRHLFQGCFRLDDQQVLQLLHNSSGLLLAEQVQLVANEEQMNFPEHRSAERQEHRIVEVQLFAVEPGLPVAKLKPI